MSIIKNESIIDNLKVKGIGYINKTFSNYNFSIEPLYIYIYIDCFFGDYIGNTDLLLKIPNYIYLTLLKK